MAPVSLCVYLHQEPADCESNLITMTDFALAMLSALIKLNKHSFNQFQLRVGQWLELLYQD